MYDTPALRSFAPTWHLTPKTLLPPSSSKLPGLLLTMENGRLESLVFWTWISPQSGLHSNLTNVNQLLLSTSQADNMVWHSTSEQPLKGLPLSNSGVLALISSFCSHLRGCCLSVTQPLTGFKSSWHGHWRNTWTNHLQAWVAKNIHLDWLNSEFFLSVTKIFIGVLC